MTLFPTLNPSLPLPFPTLNPSLPLPFPTLKPSLPPPFPTLNPSLPPPFPTLNPSLPPPFPPLTLPFLHLFPFPPPWRHKYFTPIRHNLTRETIRSYASYIALMI